MSSGITLSAATRQNLLSLQDTASLLSTTQSRLSTGKKVNSALDNPTNFFTSQSLTARSGDLSALLDGMSNGVQVIQAANQGITSIQKLLDTAKSTAQQALADKSGSTGTIVGGVAAQAATVTGTSTLGGTYDLSTLSKDASLDISLDGGATRNTIKLDASTLKNVTSNTGAVTTDQLVTAINGQIAANTNLAGNVTASVGTNGRLILTTTSTGANSKLAVNGSSSSTIDLGFGVSSTTPTAAKITAGAALAATTDFSGGKSAQFTISDGLKSVTVSLNKDTATDNLGGVLTTQAAGPPATATATSANVLKAINKQLSDSGSSITAGVDGSGNITFTSADKGLDAQLSISNITDDTTAGTGATASGTGLGFKTFIASGGVQTAGAAGSAASVQANSTVPANIDLSGGKSANFAVTGTSGGTVNIKIDAQTTSSGTALGNNPTQVQVAQAINDQLTAAGNTNFTAAFTNNKLTFTAAANGAGNITVAATNDTIGLGFGTTGVTYGTFAGGQGTPATALAAVGTDASDGSSKATVTGATPPAVANSGTFNSGTKTFDFSASQNASFTLQYGTGAPKTITLTASQFGSSSAVTEASLAKAINDQLNADTGLSGKVQASFVNDKLTIQTTAFGSSQSLSIKAGGTTDIGFGVAGAVAATSTGTDVGGAKGNSSTRSTLATQFNQLLQQISQQAQDSSYNGVNLLYRNSDNPNDNTLHITFNEKNSSALDITGVRFDATGLGLTNVTGNFQSDDDVKAALSQLTNATNVLRTQSSTFGANLSVVQNRQDFTKQLNTILDTGASNLTSADLNEEAANSQALSTRNSLAISALSLANQAQQGILQLLR